MFLPMCVLGVLVNTLLSKKNSHRKKICFYSWEVVDSSVLWVTRENEFCGFRSSSSYKLWPAG